MRQRIAPALRGHDRGAGPEQPRGVIVVEDLGPLAQRLEQRTHNPLVPGSNPGGPTTPSN